MKLITMSAAFALFATTAMAGSNATPLTEPVVLAPVATDTTRNFELVFGVNRDGFEGVVASYRAFAYTAGRFENSVNVSVGYNHQLDAAALGLEFVSAIEVAPRLTGYGSATVEYVGLTGDFSNGDAFVTPALGLEYLAADRVTAFTEVGYSWNASTDWTRAGGYAEVGIDFAVNDSFSIRPIVSRSFDTGANETTARLEGVFRF